MIKFGTDGWRAVLNKDFTPENVKRVTLAIGKYVYDTYGFNKKIIVGYDPRNMADYFAKECAKTLAQKGFEVKVSEKVIPTPVLAYNAKLLNAAAVMFTASHNPPEYLGMKFIPDYAGPATQEITDAIVENLDKEFPSQAPTKPEFVDFFPAYYEHLSKLIDLESLKNIKTNLIFDGLYSASIGYFDTILDGLNIKFGTLNMHHDINFGGGMPDPKPKYLKPLIEKVKNSQNSIGLANDGDADRFGVINENGEFVSPNEVIAILLKYLVEKGLKGSVVKTVGSSLLIDNVAKSLDINVIETAVGFKHVGEAMRNNQVIIGGEESGGLSILGHIPEKDGILANLLILEVLSKTGKSLLQLQEEIKTIGGTYYTDRIDLKKSSSEEIRPILDHFKNLTNIDSYEVTDTDLKDGVKLMLGNKRKILVRPSGTEPLLRIYFETDSSTELEDLKNIVERILKNWT